MSLDNAQKKTRPIVIVGHVDHGKSTLIGRMLYDTDSLPEGKYEEIKAVSEKRGMDMEWSFVLDAFQAERDQAVTIDTTRIWFKSTQHDYVIIDAPGHREFLKNMISGAAEAEAAILVVDATEGVREQTRRHAYLLHLLGLKRILVAINKMDVAEYRGARFGEVCQEVDAYLNELGLEPVQIIPISARHGVNITKKSDEMPWYRGGTLLEELDKLETSESAVERPMRFTVQDVYRFDETRYIAGRIETGTVSVGDEVCFSPSNRTATVTAIEKWPQNPAPTNASAGEAIALTLDQPIYVERGDLASHVENAPFLTYVFRMHLFWLGQNPMEIGKEYTVKIGTKKTKMRVQEINAVIDTDDLAKTSGEIVSQNAMAEIVLRSHELLAVDPFTEHLQTGRCVLLDGYDVVGGGMITVDGYADQRQQMKQAATNITAVDHMVDQETRAIRNGHAGAVIWLTGLSGSGKSTIAMRVEQALFRKGLQTYVLDGDNVRGGLNADLGFSPEDRTENIRRIAEVANLMADAGLVTITSFISPYCTDRKRARVAAGDKFHEVYIKADVETCETRDPKGLYKKARAGDIPEFTGVSSPYEAPEECELIVDTMKYDIETCVDQVVEYVLNNMGLQRQNEKKIA